MDKQFVEIGKARLNQSAARNGFMCYFKSELSRLLKVKDGSDLVFYQSPTGEIRVAVVKEEKTK